MSKYLTFSPIKDGIKLSPEEYTIEYPELGRANETKKLRGVELMWCWYYGSLDSPYINLEHKERCSQITALVFDKIYKGRHYDEKTLVKIRNGYYPDTWGKAIEYFGMKNTQVRARAKVLVEKIFNEFDKIVEGGMEKFTDKDGNADFQKFSSTMKMIRSEMKDMIKEVEEGFGVSEKTIGMEEGEKEGDYWNKMYLKSK